MSILLNDNLNVSAAKPVDSRYGPYASTSTAIATLPSYQRYQGLVVGILDVTILTEYWFKDGIADGDLVIKLTGSGGGTGDGYTGSSGGPGYTGSIGYTGSKGDIGDLGSRGYTGSGFTGSRGYTGSLGYSGSRGYSGSYGYTGSQSTVPGYTGSKGEKGERGPQGDSGTGGGGGSPNLDGGRPDTNYGGITSIDAGGVSI